MRLLDGQTDTANFIYPVRIPVSIRGLLFRLTGTAGAPGITLADIGRVVLRNRGNTIVDVDVAMLNALNNVGGGVPEATGLGGAGAFAVSIFIPRSYFDDNVELITPNDNAEFSIQFGPNIAALVTGFVAELYAVEAFGVQSYSLTIKQNEENIAGAGTIPSTVNQSENIVAIYVSDIPAATTPLRTLVGTVLQRIRYTVGNAFTGEFSIGAGLAKTNLDNRVEAAQSLLLEVYAAKNGDITSRLEDQAQLTFTNGAAVSRPQILVLGAMFNPNKLQETAGAASARLTDKLQMKDNTGKRRTAATVRSIVGAAS